MSREPDSTAHWNAVHQDKAADAVSWFEASPDRSLDWIARVGSADTDAVIDVGGGLSGLAGALFDRGFTDVSLLDISDAAVNRQVGARPALHGIVADIAEWRPDRTYGVWHDRAVLHFLRSDEALAGYRRALEAAVRPDGHAIFAVFAPDGPERCSGLPVRRYDAAALGEFVGTGFHRLWDERFEHVTPSGAVQRFQVAAFRRR